MAPLLFCDQYSNRIWDHIGISKEQVKQLDRITLIGCGTSWHAARIAQFFFEQICMIADASALGF